MLLYANGNNDLEPEVSAAIYKLAKTGSGKNMQVIVQWARAPQQLIQILRPNYNHTSSPGQRWAGVRRYLVEPASKQRDTLQLLCDLGSVNMAKAATLQEFICWGIKNFSADYYEFRGYKMGARASISNNWL